MAARGWVTRMSSNLGALLLQKEVDRITLSDATDLFDKRLESLDIVQSEYEMAVDLEDMASEIEDAADYRDKARVHRLAASCCHGRRCSDF